MECQCIRKASILLLLLITLGLMVLPVAATPAEDDAAARYQSTAEVSWWVELMQSVWEAILSATGSTPPPANTNNAPEPPNGDPNLQGGLDPLG